jgi:hypothetical protein
MKSEKTTTEITTLEQIAELKAAKFKQIEEQKEKIASTANALFAPVEPAVGKAESLMRLFNNGMAMFDGLMLGMKLMRVVRSLLGKRKKR